MKERREGREGRREKMERGRRGGGREKQRKEEDKDDGNVSEKCKRLRCAVFLGSLDTTVKSGVRSQKNKRASLVR